MELNPDAQPWREALCVQEVDALAACLRNARDRDT